MCSSRGFSARKYEVNIIGYVLYFLYLRIGETVPCFWDEIQYYYCRIFLINIAISTYDLLDMMKKLLVKTRFLWFQGMFLVFSKRGKSFYFR